MMEIYSQRNSFLINFKEGDVQLQRLPSGIPLTRGVKFYTIKDGDTLESIASKELRNPQEWYRIADMNQIINPFDLVVGNKLTLPEPLDV